MIQSAFFLRFALILAFLSAANAASTSAFGALTIDRTARWNACHPGGFCPSMSGNSHKARVALGGQNAVGEPASDALPHNVLEAGKVGFEPVIETKHLLRDVTEKVVWRNGHVCATERSLEQREEILGTVGVDVPAHVFGGMIDGSSPVSQCKIVVGRRGIRENQRTGFDLAANQRTKPLAIVRTHHVASHLAWLAALHDGMDDRFSNSAATTNDLFAATLVHVGRFAADVAGIGFHRAIEFIDAAKLHRLANARLHKPRRLLCHATVSTNLVGRAAVAAAGDEPRRQKPLLQFDFARFVDRANGQRKLFAAPIALVLAPASHPGDFIAVAMQAANAASRPSDRAQIIIARDGIGPEFYGGLQGQRVIRFGHRSPIEWESVSGVAHEHGWHNRRWVGIRHQPLEFGDHRVVVAPAHLAAASGLHTPFGLVHSSGPGDVIFTAIHFCGSRKSSLVGLCFDHAVGRSCAGRLSFFSRREFASLVAGWRATGWHHIAVIIPLATDVFATRIADDIDAIGVAVAQLACREPVCRIAAVVFGREHFRALNIRNGVCCLLASIGVRQSDFRHALRIHLISPCFRDLFARHCPHYTDSDCCVNYLKRDFPE